MSSPRCLLQHQPIPYSSNVTPAGRTNSLEPVPAQYARQVASCHQCRWYLMTATRISREIQLHLGPLTPGWLRMEGMPLEICMSGVQLPHLACNSLDSLPMTTRPAVTSIRARPSSLTSAMAVITCSWLAFQALTISLTILAFLRLLTLRLRWSRLRSTLDLQAALHSNQLLTKWI